MKEIEVVWLETTTTTGFSQPNETSIERSFD